jgi:hypothetical protein
MRIRTRLREGSARSLRATAPFRNQASPPSHQATAGQAGNLRVYGREWGVGLDLGAALGLGVGVCRGIAVDVPVGLAAG